MTILNKSSDFAGELGCVEIFHTPVKLKEEQETSYYLFGVLDTCTQIVWVEVIEQTDDLTFMFASLKCFTVFSDYYSIKFKEIKSNDTLSGLLSKMPNVNSPFERLLDEQNILLHKSDESLYTTTTCSLLKEFWDSIYIDLLSDVCIKNKKSLKQKIVEYLYYYNEKRVHKNLRGMTPNGFNKLCARHV